MAIRRMFAKSIIDSDDFLDLPLDVQLLYFHLGMQADDEGFLNSTKKIVRLLGVEPDALQILCDMGFLIPFPSGVMAIRHWHVNNKIRKDRYSGTQFVAEWEQLVQRYEVYEWASQGEQGVETSFGEAVTTCQPLTPQAVTTCQPTFGQAGAKDRIGKDRVGKDREGKVSEVERSEGEKREEKQSAAQPSGGEETRLVAPPVGFSTNPQPTEAASEGEREEKEEIDLAFQRKKAEALERLRNYQVQPVDSKEPGVSG